MQIDLYRAEKKDQVCAFFKEVFSEAESEQEGNMLELLMWDILSENLDKDFFGLLAWDGDQLLGGVFFSCMDFANQAKAYLLSPLAVATVSQGRGVGSALVKEGMGRLRSLGASHVFTYGDPNYYSRFGFQSAEKIPAPYPLSFPNGWMVINLTDKDIEFLRKPVCISVFSKASYW